MSKVMLMNIFLAVFIVGAAAMIGTAILVAISDPGARAEPGRCYLIVARPGITGYLSGPKHVEIACP